MAAWPFSVTPKIALAYLCFVCSVLLPGVSNTAERVHYHYDIGKHRCCLVIAHAGGGVEGNAYTNSQEAVLSNLRIGVRVFEVDFSSTRDGVWVGTHDWKLWQSQTGYQGMLPPAYREFSQLELARFSSPSVRGSYTPITIPFLEEVVARHKDIVIITDTKYNVGKMAEELKTTKLFRHIYPQAYSIHDVVKLSSLGYKHIILTIYRMDHSAPEDMIKRIEGISGKLFALTVPMYFFVEHHKALTKIGIPIYLHGSPTNINSRELHDRSMRLGVSGFYLD